MTMIQTYIPLYRKYRPQAFADVVGQEAIIQTLSNALNLSKVAHAYLFCGPRGTGKTSTARIFAKSLNCEQGPTVTPCQTCASCSGITAGNALDVIEFDAASNNGVQDARELIENVQFTPLAGKYKIYIIDEVHMLTTQAFNALLKTLEEPPPNVVFIFATTEAHKVLPTIISRCQRFDFNRITHQDIIKRLAWIAEQETIHIAPDALEMIGRHVRGGMRDAVGLLDQVAVLGRGETGQAAKLISRSDVTLFIGALEEDMLIGLSQAIADKQPDVILQTLNTLEQQGIESAQLVKELTGHFRNLLLVSACQQDGNLSANQLDLPDSYFQKLQAQTTLFALEELPQILSKLSGTERHIRTTQQPQLWLEVGLMELAYREGINTVQNLSERVAKLEAALAAGIETRPLAQPQQSAPKPLPSKPIPTAFEPKPEPALVVPSAAPITSGDGLFQQICQAVANSNTRGLLEQQAFLISHTGNKLVIGCASEPIVTTLKNPKKFIHLQKAADQILGQTTVIDVVVKKNQAPMATPTSEAVPEPEKVLVMAGHISSPPNASEPEIQPNRSEPAPSIPTLPIPQQPDPPKAVHHNTEDLSEAKQYTVQLLQGKIIE